MRVRSEQLQVFEQSARARSHGRLLLHARSFSPLITKPLDDDTMRRLVEKSVAKANRYRMFDHGYVTFYLELMLSLGSDFDTDPQISWAGEALRSRFIRNESELADELNIRMQLYSEEVIGPKHLHFHRAVGHFAEILSKPESIEKSLKAGTPGMLKLAYPEKYIHAGEHAMRQVIRESEDAANEHYLPSPIGGAIIALLMFGMGYGVLTDNAYPWIVETLSDPSESASYHKIQNLCDNARKFYDRILDEGDRANQNGSELP